MSDGQKDHYDREHANDPEPTPPACQHFNAYATPCGRTGTLKCPQCNKTLSASETKNMEIQLLRMAAGIKEIIPS